MAGTNSVLLLGGTGFIGRHLANILGARGSRVCIPTRQHKQARDHGRLPNIEWVESDVNDPVQLNALVATSTTVVNLVGVLHSPSGQPYGKAFARAHVELPRKLVAACELAGGRRLIHLSALGAAADAPSEYLRSKADGELAIRTESRDSEWTLFRPSVVFGPQDRFLNLFANLAWWTPVLPLAGANARFQPVYVGDVCRAICYAIDHRAGIDKCFDLAGPKVYTLAELVRYAAAQRGRVPWIVPLPAVLAQIQARILERLPGPLMSRDNLSSMKCDNVASGEAQPFGLVPTALESVAPSWLAHPKPGAR